MMGQSSIDVIEDCLDIIHRVRRKQFTHRSERREDRMRHLMDNEKAMRTRIASGSSYLATSKKFDNSFPTKSRLKQNKDESSVDKEEDEGNEEIDKEKGDSRQKQTTDRYFRTSKASFHLEDGSSDEDFDGTTPAAERSAALLIEELTQQFPPIGALPPRPLKDQPKFSVKNTYSSDEDDDELSESELELLARRNSGHGQRQSPSTQVSMKKLEESHNELFSRFEEVLNQSEVSALSMEPGAPRSKFVDATVAKLSEEFLANGFDVQEPTDELLTMKRRVEALIEVFAGLADSSDPATTKHISEEPPKRKDRHLLHNVNNGKDVESVLLPNIQKTKKVTSGDPEAHVSMNSFSDIDLPPGITLQVLPPTSSMQSIPYSVATASVKPEPILKSSASSESMRLKSRERKQRVTFEVPISNSSEEGISSLENSGTPKSTNKSSGDPVCVSSDKVAEMPHSMKRTDSSLDNTERIKERERRERDKIRSQYSDFVQKKRQAQAVSTPEEQTLKQYASLNSDIQAVINSIQGIKS